jgi:hypothetical protein
MEQEAKVNEARLEARKRKEAEAVLAATPAAEEAPAAEGEAPSAEGEAPAEA